MAKRNGKCIGRQKGETVYNVKLRPYEKDIMKAYKNGQSINSLAKDYEVNWQTMKTIYYIFYQNEETKEWVIFNIYKYRKE